MGTSTRNKGPSGHTPLVPSWLKDDDETQASEDQSQTILANPIPPEADANRFRGPRSSLTRYSNSSGESIASARRGISDYVRHSLGGSSKALQHLGSARKSTARLHGVLNVLSSGGGVREVARMLSLNNLEGLPATQFFTRIVEFVCPDGGPNDEGIARSSYFKTIVSLDILSKQTEQLSIEECESVLVNFMSRVITEKIENDIANKIILLPGTIDEISRMEDAIYQLIQQDVSDAMTEVHSMGNTITSDDAQRITDEIYIRTFDLLGRLED